MLQPGVDCCPENPGEYTRTCVYDVYHHQVHGRHIVRLRIVYTLVYTLVPHRNTCLRKSPWRTFPM